MYNTVFHRDQNATLKKEIKIKPKILQKSKNVKFNHTLLEFGWWQREVPNTNVILKLKEIYSCTRRASQTFTKLTVHKFQHFIP